MQSNELHPSNKMSPHRGSHIPVLLKLLPITRGPIIELGCGLFSTPLLHWACFPTKRTLITYENNPDWIGFARLFENDYHRVFLVNDWDRVDFYFPISIALVDHGPDKRRKEEVKKLVNADFVVLHDAGNKRDRVYKFSTIRHLFKYRWKYDKTGPMTAVWSNKFDITGLEIP